MRDHTALGSERSCVNEGAFPVFDREIKERGFALGWGRTGIALVLCLGVAGSGIGDRIARIPSINF